MKKIKLTKAESAIMQILWNNGSPLSIRDIPEIEPTLNPNTVATAVKQLQKKGMIKVADITYHGSALTRLFAPAMSREDYALSALHADNIPIMNVISAFVGKHCDAEDLEQLEKMIAAEKKKKDK